MDNRNRGFLVGGFLGLGVVMVFFKVRVVWVALAAFVVAVAIAAGVGVLGTRARGKGSEGNFGLYMGDYMWTAGVSMFSVWGGCMTLIDWVEETARRAGG